LALSPPGRYGFTWQEFDYFPWPSFSMVDRLNNKYGLTWRKIKLNFLLFRSVMVAERFFAWAFGQRAYPLKEDTD
jgi:hypothetical protein